MKKVQLGVSAIHFAQTLHFQIFYTYFFKNIRHLQCGSNYKIQKQHSISFSSHLIVIRTALPCFL